MPRRKAASKGTTFSSALSVLILGVLAVIYFLTGGGSSGGVGSGEPTSILLPATDTPEVSSPAGPTPVVTMAPTAIPGGLWWEVYLPTR